MEKDNNLLKFEPNYADILPQDWKDKNAPTTYEILATLNTLKKLYAQQVEQLENGLVEKSQGEAGLCNIAANYQSIKALLFQPR